MSDAPPPPPSDPVSRDDRLLDALASGEQPPPDHAADDPVTALLADWRAELVANSEQVEQALEQSQPRADVPTAPPTTPRPARPVLRRRNAATVGPATPRRRRTAVTAAALSVLTALGGLWLGAARAQPGGLLWPVAELVNADRVQSVRTEQEVGRTLDKARKDLADRRYAEARIHIERAAALLGTLDDDQSLTRLRADIDELRHLLPPAAPTTPSTPDAPASPGAVPVPPVPGPAMSTALEPAPVPPTSAQSTPTGPAPAGRSPKSPTGASAGLPSTPSAGRRGQPSSSPTPTVPEPTAKPHRDDSAAARPPTPGPRSAGMAGRTRPRRDAADRIGPGQPATVDPARRAAGTPDESADPGVSTAGPDLG